MVKVAAIEIISPLEPASSSPELETELETELAAELAEVGINMKSNLKLESIHEIENLMKSYCLFFDTKKSNALSQLFTDGARIDYGPEIEQVVGRIKLEEMISAGARDRFEATNHQICNEIITFESEDIARGTSHLYAWHKYYGSDLIGHLWGGYRYKFLRTESGWLIDELQLFATGMENFHRETMHVFGTILDK